MIADTISSNRINPVYIVTLGSSSIDGEYKNFLPLHYSMSKGFYPIGHYLLHDIASYAESLSPVFGNETYIYREMIPEEMLEHDIIVKMHPRRIFAIKAKITRIRKAEPQMVIPENSYTGI